MRWPRGGKDGGRNLSGKGRIDDQGWFPTSATLARTAAALCATTGSHQMLFVLNIKTRPFGHVSGKVDVQGLSSAIIVYTTLHSDKLIVSDTA